MARVASVTLKGLGSAMVEMPTIAYGVPVHIFYFWALSANPSIQRSTHIFVIAGVGTAWFASGAERKAALESSLDQALDAGFRHIDEAEMYKVNNVTDSESAKLFTADTLRALVLHCSDLATHQVLPF